MLLFIVEDGASPFIAGASHRIHRANEQRLGYSLRLRMSPLSPTLSASRRRQPSSRPFQPSPAFAGEGRQGKRERAATAGSRVGALLHLAEHVVEVEGGGLLALRILPERLQELPDEGLRRHQQEDVVA